MTKWEYFCFDLDWKTNPQTLLNVYGQEGWELVAALPTIPIPGYNFKNNYLMKRAQLSEDKA